MNDLQPAPIPLTAHEEGFPENPPNPQDDLHVLVMTHAGKPIFNTWPSSHDEKLNNVCGLIQALQASTLNEEGLGHGELQFLTLSKCHICFMTVGAITLVAVLTQKDGDLGGDAGINLRLRLILEEVYCGIIFLLTDSVQEQLIHNPNLDRTGLLGLTTPTILTRIVKGMRNEAPFASNVGSRLGGIPIFGPVPYEMRTYMSSVLTTICSKYESILFALVTIQGQLFNLLQPHRHMLQLQPYDLNMLLSFLESQNTLEGNELWVPLCLPRLDQTGFVHAYRCSLDGSMSLVLLSQNGSLEEFTMLQQAAREIQTCAGLEREKKPIMRIYSLNSDFGSSDEDLVWELTHEKDPSEHSGSDVRDIDLKLNPSQGENKAHCLNLIRNFQRMVRKVIRYNEEVRNRMMADYCSMGAAVHFHLQCYTPIRHFQHGKPSVGTFSQCIGPCMNTLPDDLLKQRVYEMYEKLSIQLRFDSLSVESTMDALDTITNDSSKECHDISQYCPSRLLHESIPPKGRSYILNGEELFYCFSDGDTFVFYATLSATTTPTEANILCSALVETMRKDMDRLLISKPLSF